MNIYFACSLTGGRDDQAVYDVIVKHLLASGHEVPTAHLADVGIMNLERVVDAHDVYRRDTDWIKGCDVLIAEVSTPSHGVGYEIAYALGLGKPLLACHKRDVPVSKMILGNDSLGLAVEDYASEAEALALIDDFLAGQPATET